MFHKSLFYIFIIILSFNVFTTNAFWGKGYQPYSKNTTYNNLYVISANDFNDDILLRIDNATNTTSDIIITKKENGININSTSTISVGSEGMKEVTFTQNWGQWTGGSGTYRMDFSFGDDIAKYTANVSYATITPSISAVGPIKATGIPQSFISETNPQSVIQVEEGSTIEPICEKSTGLYKKKSTTNGKGDKLEEKLNGGSVNDYTLALTNSKALYASSSDVGDTYTITCENIGGTLTQKTMSYKIVEMTCPQGMIKVPNQLRCVGIFNIINVSHIEGANDVTISFRTELPVLGGEGLCEIYKNKVNGTLSVYIASANTENGGFRVSANIPKAEFDTNNATTIYIACNGDVVGMYPTSTLGQANNTNTYSNLSVDPSFWGVYSYDVLLTGIDCEYPGEIPDSTGFCHAPCDNGQYWDEYEGECKEEPTMTGTITPQSSTCVIALNQSSCNINISWIVNNPVSSASSITSNIPSNNTIIANGHSGSNFAVSIPYGNKSFYLYNNNVELDTDILSASCISGTSWDMGQNKCVAEDVEAELNCSKTSYPDDASNKICGYPNAVCAFDPFDDNKVNCAPKFKCYIRGVDNPLLAVSGGNGNIDTSYDYINANSKDYLIQFEWAEDQSLYNFKCATPNDTRNVVVRALIKPFSHFLSFNVSNSQVKKGETINMNWLIESPTSTCKIVATNMKTGDTIFDTSLKSNNIEEKLSDNISTSTIITNQQIRKSVGDYKTIMNGLYQVDNSTRFTASCEQVGSYKPGIYKIIKDVFIIGESER